MTTTDPAGPRPVALLGWSLLACCIAQAVIWYIVDKGGTSPIFWYLLRTYDTHGNALVAAIVFAAFVLRGRADALQVVRIAAERPWACAALAFPLLCVGALQVYRAHPVSMDEYSTLFQSHVFAAGKLSGVLPPELLDRLIPRHFHGQFFSVARETGEVSSMYWPSFPLLLAPFSWLGVPWMANPLIAALTLPAVHAFAREVTGSRDAGGWALLLTAASPVFVVTSISLYSMPAHLLFNLWYAVLLLRPTPARAALAGLCGSIALTLHFPLRHVLFAAPLVAWVLLQPGRAKNLLALAAGYAPLGLLLGLGWHAHITDASRVVAALPTTSAATALAPPPPAVAASPVLRALDALRLPGITVLDARFATLTKDWTWSAAGTMVLAGYGIVRCWALPAIRVLAAVLVVTFVGYFASAGDQGHGWGDRTLYQAWFILPVLASAGLVRLPSVVPQAAAMAAWLAVLSLLLANGLRLMQVHGFVGQFLRQVPPLAQPANRERPQVVFVNLAKGFYTRDLVQNDPFLRGPRIVMVMGPAESAEALMAARFPGYRKVREGEWGQLWEHAPK